MKPSDFSYHLTRYLTDYLAGQRNSSRNTLKTYRDTFKLFLVFCKNEKGIQPERLTLSKISDTLVREYYDWLEKTRGCSPISRNNRRTAINSFFKYVQIEAPEHLLLCQKILSIPKKRCTKPVIGYLTPDMLKLLLSMPDKANVYERRELVLMTVLYDTGARVQELCDLRVRDLRLESPAIVTLTGKGRKTRHVPLMKNTVSLLSRYLEDQRIENPYGCDRPLFMNRHHAAYTRKGISYILEKYEKRAREVSSLLPDFTISPHIFRHSKAMHLYQAGIDLIYIRDILGHVDIATTEVYARIDTERKRDALENAYPEITGSTLADWNDDEDLIRKLSRLV